MGKYSDPGTGMSVTGTEAVYPLVAVAIDNNNKTSQGALKWAVEHLVKRGQTLVLVHVNTKGASSKSLSKLTGMVENVLFRDCIVQSLSIRLTMCYMIDL